MTFAQMQHEINSAWKQRKRPVAPRRQRKKDMCVKCAKQGFEVKLEFIENQHVTMSYTRYDVSILRCPRCGHVDKQWMRIEGKGKGGANSGCMFGSR